MAQRKNYHTVRYGTRDGEIQFGHIHQDNNESAVMLRSGHDPLHYITMDHTGDEVRKNSTICKSPGSFLVKAGVNAKKSKNNESNDAGILLDSESGDIIIRAPKGKLRIEAQDIEMIAKGYNGKTGMIKLDSNEKIVLKSKSVDIRAVQTAKFFSENKLDVAGNAILNIYGGLVDISDGATAVLGSKTGPSSTQTNAKRFKQFLTSLIS